MLITGRTFWNTTVVKKVVSQPAPAHTQADILVVGGGVSGALCAYHFAKAGYDVILIDRGLCGRGSSCASTGLLQFCSDMSLSEGIQHHGLKRSLALYRAGVEALDTIEALCRRLPRSVQYIKRSSVCYASNAADAPALKKEAHTLQQHGFAAEYLSRAALKAQYGLSAPCGMRTQGDIQLNPYALVQETICLAQNQYRLRVFEHTEYLEQHPSPSGRRLAVKTSTGAIACDDIVFTSGYTENEMTQACKRPLQRVRSYAVVTRPLPAAAFWPEKAMIWETARPYLYLRHAQGNRIVIGGLDEKLTDMPDAQWLTQRTDELNKRFAQLFPAIPFVPQYRYAAVFGDTLDGFPVIGRQPQYAHSWVLFGFGGNGTVYSAIGARLLLDLIAGRKNPYEPVFAAGRKTQLLPE